MSLKRQSLRRTLVDDCRDELGKSDREETKCDDCKSKLGMKMMRDQGPMSDSREGI